MAPMQFENMQMLGRLGVALALGLLIGLERGWERRELPEGQRAAGFRTFGIIGLLGAVTVQLGTPLLLVAIGAALGLLAALGYWRESQREQDVS
jgi:MgtC family